MSLSTHEKRHMPAGVRCVDQHGRECKFLAAWSIFAWVLYIEPECIGPPPGGFQGSLPVTVRLSEIEPQPGEIDRKKLFNETHHKPN